MRDAPALDRATGGSILVRRSRKRSSKRHQTIVLQAATCTEVHEPGLDAHYETELSVAEAPGALGDRLEYWLHVGRRAADDAQDLARRRLLLQRLGEAGVLRLQLGE